MRAIHISSLDGPDSVEVVDLPDPHHEDLVTIEVKAAGVAFPELLQTRGLYQVKPDLPFVPGAEVAGVVTAAEGRTAAIACAVQQGGREVVSAGAAVLVLPEK